MFSESIELTKLIHALYKHSIAYPHIAGLNFAPSSSTLHQLGNNLLVGFREEMSQQVQS